MGIHNVDALKNNDDHDEGIFPHKCITLECTNIVQYDDEPWCFTHSPDDGSSLLGYSARAAAKKVSDG